MGISVGATFKHRFVIDTAAMQAFASLSNDRSSIHTNDAFARERGYERAIVYGGLLLAHLSHVLGTKLPGDLGTSVHWEINYRHPLYVGEEAVLTITVDHVSAAMELVQAKFTVHRGDRLVASGKTQSFVPASNIEDVPMSSK